MWTEITRPKYERSDRRYASDLSDAEWGLIAPYMPPPKTLGRHRRHPLPVAQWLPVATATQGLPTALNRATLLRPLARQRFVGAHQSSTPDDCP